MRVPRSSLLRRAPQETNSLHQALAKEAKPFPTMHAHPQRARGLRTTVEQPRLLSRSRFGKASDIPSISHRETTPRACRSVAGLAWAGWIGREGDQPLACANRSHSLPILALRGLLLVADREGRGKFHRQVTMVPLPGSAGGQQGRGIEGWFGGRGCAGRVRLVLAKCLWRTGDIGGRLLAGG